MNVAIDTNVFCYAENLNGPEKKAEALALLEKLVPESTLIPVQVLGELFVALVRKGRRPPETARAAVLSWGDTFPLIETSSDILASAADLAVTHQLCVLGLGDPLGGGRGPVPAASVRGHAGRVHVAGRHGRQSIFADAASAARCARRGEG